MLEVYTQNTTVPENTAIPFNNTTIQKGSTVVKTAPTTIQFNRIGVYMVAFDASVSLSEGTAADNIVCQLYKNGSISKAYSDFKNEWINKYPENKDTSTPTLYQFKYYLYKNNNKSNISKEKAGEIEYNTQSAEQAVFSKPFEIINFNHIKKHLIDGNLTENLFYLA